MPAPSHFSRLALIFALSALPTLLTAQTPNTQTTTPSKDTVLFDFEAGNFDGWTLTGDCWDKQPATPKTFTDKQGNSVISGIVGSGYLTTLYKNAATGKDFTIDKLFSPSRLAAGGTPKKRASASSLTAKLSAYWDVYAFMGKSRER